MSPTPRLPVRLPELPPPPGAGVVDVAPPPAGTVRWTPLVWSFDPEGDPARPFVLEQDATYTVPAGYLPARWRDRVTIPAGRRSDGPTLGRAGLVAAGVQGVDPYLLFAGSWLHDELLHLLAVDALRIPRSWADRLAYLAWLSTPGLDLDDAREAHLGVRLGTAHAEAGPLLRLAVRLAGRVAPRLALRLLRR